MTLKGDLILIWAACAGWGPRFAWIPPVELLPAMNGRRVGLCDLVVLLISATPAGTPIFIFLSVPHFGCCVSNLTLSLLLILQIWIYFITLIALRFSKSHSYFHPFFQKFIKTSINFIDRISTCEILRLIRCSKTYMSFNHSKLHFISGLLNFESLLRKAVENPSSMYLS